MEIKNIGLALDWAKGQDVLMGTDSKIINRAMEEYAALQENIESANTAEAAKNNNKRIKLVCYGCEEECSGTLHLNKVALCESAEWSTAE